MLYWAALSLVIATITASLGFTGTAPSAVEAAKVIFLFFLILFTGSLVFGMVRRRTVKPVEIAKKD